MSGFDEFIVGAKKCFDYASVKANEVVETSRIQLEKSQITCKIKDKYIELGKVCYDISEKGVDQTTKMKKLIAEIKTLKQDLALANENLSGGKFKICQSCGATNLLNSEFCSKCGTKL